MRFNFYCPPHIHFAHQMLLKQYLDMYFFCVYANVIYIIANSQLVHNNIHKNV